MNKVKEINGHKYSREQFDGYKRRAIIKASVVGEENDSDLNLFTTNTSATEVMEVMNGLKNPEKVISLTLYHWCTVEDDEAASKFIDMIHKEVDEKKEKEKDLKTSTIYDEVTNTLYFKKE